MSTNHMSAPLRRSGPVLGDRSNQNSRPVRDESGAVDVGPIPLAFNENGGRYRAVPPLPLSRRPQPNPAAWHTRRRDILGRLIRGTEAPTDTLPVLVNPERTQLSEHYDARLGEVLELAVSIGSVLMASGTSASATVIQVKAIAAAYGIENCDVDVTNTVIFIAVYRGPTLPPASTLHTVRSRSIDFSRLAAVDRLIRRIRTSRYRPRRHAPNSTESSPPRTRTNAGSPPWPGAGWRSRWPAPWAATSSSVSSAP